MTLCGTVATALFPVGRVFFTGDTTLTEHGMSIMGLLTGNGRALTAMAADQQREGPSTPLPNVDWGLSLGR